MNKTEKIGRLHVAMHNLGLTPTETTALIWAERVLRRWAEAECNGDITRDESTGKPYRQHGRGTGGPFLTESIPDREAGALRRIEKILKAHPGLWYYHQTDPRGCALYVGKVADLPPDSDLSSCYSQGIAVCI